VGAGWAGKAGCRHRGHRAQREETTAFLRRPENQVQFRASGRFILK
jgi:hypothetical protein